MGKKIKFFQREKEREMEKDGAGITIPTSQWSFFWCHCNCATKCEWECLHTGGVCTVLLLGSVWWVGELMTSILQGLPTQLMEMACEYVCSVVCVWLGQCDSLIPRIGDALVYPNRHPYQITKKNTHKNRQQKTTSIPHTWYSKLGDCIYSEFRWSLNIN